MNGESWNLPEVAEGYRMNMDEEIYGWKRARALILAGTIAAHWAGTQGNSVNRIIDLGCGAGAHLWSLGITVFNAHYRGYDRSEAMIERARTYWDKNPHLWRVGYSFHVASIPDVDVSDCEMVFTSQAIEYMEDPRAELENLLKRMRRGQVFVLHKLRLVRKSDGAWVEERTYAGHSENLYFWHYGFLLDLCAHYARDFACYDWPLDREIVTIAGIVA